MPPAHSRAVAGGGEGVICNLDYANTRQANCRSTKTPAAEVLRRRWLEGGYYRLAMLQHDFEIVEALAELAPPPEPQPEPLLLELGAACGIRGG